MITRKTFWRIVWWYAVFCFWAKPPLYAQTMWAATVECVSGEQA